MNEESVRIPYIPLRGQTFFPNTVVGFDIGRDKSLKSVELAMNRDKYVVVSTQIDSSVNDPGMEDCYLRGVLLRVKQIVKRGDDYVRVLASAESRVDIIEIADEGDHLACLYVPASDQYHEIADDELEALERLLADAYFTYVELTNSGETAARAMLESAEDAGSLADLIAGEINISYEIKQEILEADGIPERIEKLIGIIHRENQVLRLTRKISTRVMQNMNKGQKDYYLREQIKVIREELGENESQDDEIGEWNKKLDALKLPEKIDAKIRKEIAKYGKMNMMSPDANVSRTYIETVLGLPWNQASKTNIDLKKAEKILNEDHYGLEKVKERILEYLAVLHLTREIKGPILCLVGPPGVGKTSIARSIARATNREFIRMSLGGVRDEAEIRGHRRTYVGAIPGRIISSISECGVNNPLFLFDEVDKIGSDYRGDPASALLEVLDPEQNRAFTDHYLEIPFDLSKVMFITTANTAQTIPGPLLDRMEVIDIPSYIEEEKVRIAKDYLIPKKMKEYHIPASKFRFTDPALRALINGYTREAGVRNLEREIASVLRKGARKIVADKKKSYTVTAGNLESYLGRKPFREDVPGREPEIGVTTGMAWTAVGGVTLSIETVKMPGSGRLILTGQMGNVMQESAQAALGYIKSLSEKYQISEETFKNSDIQIHIPEGATPKDGPSAGVTMCTALFSLLTERAVDRNIAMTGEITLRGRILPVGGIREKVLAAYRQGIRKILLPRENESSIEDIPESVRKKIRFVLIETAEEAFREVLIEPVQEDNGE